MLVHNYQYQFHKTNIGLLVKGAPKGGDAGGLQLPQTLQYRNLKNTDFVDIMISKVLRDFRFGQNQPLKAADDQYIRILKNKLIKLKKTRK
jgi:hypothetical protein